MTEDRATGDYGQFNAIDQVQASNIVEQSKEFLAMVQSLIE
jgi:hypothetical protein